jgi:hypothetical protein
LIRHGRGMEIRATGDLDGVIEHDIPDHHGPRDPQRQRDTGGAAIESVHLVIWSSGHLVIWLFRHLVI